MRFCMDYQKLNSVTKKSLLSSAHRKDILTIDVLKGNVCFNKYWTSNVQ